MVADQNLRVEMADNNAGASSAADAAAAGTAGIEQMEETDECRICRSSVAELLEAEEGLRGSCCSSLGFQLRSCKRTPQRRPLLHRLSCACAGSVRHVCARCYRRYYVARGLSACEICRQPTGLEGAGVESIDNVGCCSRLASAACSDEARFIIYALFLTFAFVAIFVIFFVANAADSATDASAPSRPSTTTKSPQPPGPQRRLERIIFVGVVSVNLGVALAYICYSYWRHYRRAGRCCGQRRRQSDIDASDAEDAQRHRPQVAALPPNVLVVGAVTVPQLPQQPPWMAASV